MSETSNDDQLKKAIMDEFEWHALIEPSQLAVSVEGGVVTLVGTVGSVAEKVVAIDAAETIGGVHDVIARIDVKLPPPAERSDNELDAIIEQVLTWDALVPELDVVHAVTDGWVTLSGSVPTARQRDETERAVGHIVGVRGVTNNLTLSDPDLAPQLVHGAIEDALARRALHRAKHIDLTLDDHKVTLSGTVQSASEKRAVLGAVSHAPGVETVCDELYVRPEY